MKQPQRAISLSGSPNITMGLPAAHAQNQPLLATLGCSAADGYPTREQRLTCLRALPAKEVARAMPWAWTIPGMNGLPLSPAGQGYYGERRAARVVGRHVRVRPTAFAYTSTYIAGIPVVDGQVLAMPVLDALLDGVVDVPVMIGTVYACGGRTRSPHRVVNRTYLPIHVYTNPQETWPRRSTPGRPTKWRRCPPRSGGLSCGAGSGSAGSGSWRRQRLRTGSRGCTRTSRTATRR